MTSEEAGQSVTELIRSNSIPTPPLARWALPEMLPDSSGVRLGAQQVIVFAPSRASNTLLVPYVELVPFLSEEQLRWIAANDRAVLLPHLNDDGKDSFFSSPTAAFFTHVDLEVSSVVLHREYGGATRAKPLIEKGGYSVALGALGLIFSREGTSSLLLFDSPIDTGKLLADALEQLKKGGVSQARLGAIPVYPGAFRLQPNGIELAVVGKTLRFRPVGLP